MKNTRRSNDHRLRLETGSRYKHYKPSEDLFDETSNADSIESTAYNHEGLDGEGVVPKLQYKRCPLCHKMHDVNDPCLDREKPVNSSTSRPGTRIETIWFSTSLQRLRRSSG